jgi:hypothetical protein
MTLLTIWLIACPIADPSACRKIRLEVSGGHVGAMHEVAMWTADHEGYRVLSWRAGR